jgi:hypothetical protein
MVAEHLAQGLVQEVVAEWFGAPPAALVSTTAPGTGGFKRLAPR